MSDYENLRKLYNEIDELIDNEATTSSLDFKNWNKHVERFLSKKYGEQSKEYKDFTKISFDPPAILLPALSKLNSSERTRSYIGICKLGLETAKAELAVYLEEMKEEEEEKLKLKANTPQEKDEKRLDQKIKDKKKVFIVHGHDEAKRRELKEFLKDKLKLDPIVLSDQLPEKTLIDKFEKYAKQCSYAFIIYTPDDQVSNQKQEYFQARPNVIFELGWFYAHFAGSPNICILKQETDAKDNLIFSDLQGVEYLTFRKDIEEKFYRIQEILKASGIIDKN